MTEQLHFHFSLSCIGEGNGNPLQCSCLEYPRERGAWWAAVYRVAQSQTWLKRLSSSSSIRISLPSGSLLPPPSSHSFRSSQSSFPLAAAAAAAAKSLQKSDSMRPHRWQPTRLSHPCNSPGKNTGVGCHFLLQCMKVNSESEVAQSCLTLSNPMNCSLPGSSVRGIF